LKLITRTRPQLIYSGELIKVGLGDNKDLLGRIALAAHYNADPKCRRAGEK